MHFYCSDCKKIYRMDTLAYKCTCGGLFALYKEEGETVEATVSLGEVETPLLKSKIGNLEVFLKLDHLHPTGSFKDRGAFTLVNQIKKLGIEEVVNDSSGNAGAAIAAYCAAAGIKCNIYLPENTSLGKVKQIAAYGATLVKVPGTRDDTSVAALAAAKDIYYASHVYNPLFLEGTKSIVNELYRQIGVPDYIFAPTGNGTLLLGLYLGFKEIGKLPKIIAVQSENCKPVYNAFHELEETPVQPTLAEGIAVGKPMRIKEMVAAIKESGGDVVTVSDDEIAEAQIILGTKGIYAESTSSSALAGAKKYFPKGKPDNYSVVVPMSSTGLKK